MRRIPFIATLLGVALLVAGLLITTNSISQGNEQQKALQRDADQISASFSSYFERSRSLNLLLAQSPALAMRTNRTVDLAAANRAIAYLEFLYPGAIGEACLINDKGVELARVTHGVTASAEDLSPDEAANDFFSRTLVLPAGLVYQAPPYVSPDTKRWVISNSTWVRQLDGSRLIVHFEVSLDSFSPYLEKRTSGSHVVVLDRGNGRIILGDGVPLPVPSGSSQFPKTDWSAAFADTASVDSPPHVDGRRAASQRVQRTPGNEMTG